MVNINQIEPFYDNNEIEAVLSYLKSGGWIMEHKKTKELEEMIAKYVGSRFCAMLPNGTLTLWACLAVLKIGIGDEVIVPDFTMVATPNAVKLSGASVVLADINKETLCLDIKEVEKKINKKTKAIFLVSINGRCPHIKKFVDLCKKHKIFLLEDSAQSFGSRVGGKHLGTFGTFGSFSFSMPKIITMGQGGALVTDDEEKYKVLCKFKDFGRSKGGEDNYEMIGYNLKFSDLSAVFGIEQMKKMDDRTKKKKEIFSWYKEMLKDVSFVTFFNTSEETSPWFVDILAENRDDLKKYLEGEGIKTRSFYPALHTLPFYNSGEVFKNSLLVSKKGLWLPSSLNLSKRDVEYICEKIRIFYK